MSEDNMSAKKKKTDNSVDTRCKKGVQSDCDWKKEHDKLVNEFEDEITEHKERVETLDKRKEQLAKRKTPSSKWKKKHAAKVKAINKRLGKKVPPEPCSADNPLGCTCPEALVLFPGSYDSIEHCHRSRSICAAGLCTDGDGNPVDPAPYRALGY
jgi:hypothetical protein